MLVTLREILKIAEAIRTMKADVMAAMEVFAR